MLPKEQTVNKSKIMWAYKQALKGQCCRQIASKRKSYVSKIVRKDFLQQGICFKDSAAGYLHMSVKLLWQDYLAWFIYKIYKSNFDHF